MNTKQKLVIAIAAACGALAVFLIVLKPAQDRKEWEAEWKEKEAAEVAAANRILYAEIFERCKGVPELQQFISLYNPTEALEFFDNETMTEVVSVACVTDIDERFTATFVAPVEINGEETYSLTGDIDFRIEDKNGTFRKINPTGYSEGSSISLNSREWKNFMATNGDIESLRVIHANADQHPSR